MKKGGKSVFFIITVLILFLAYTAFFGIESQYGDIRTVYIKGGNDIRWGIDIRGGVDVTFTPPADIDATETEMAAAEAVVKQRLVSQNITDSEVYTDYNKNRIIVRFPWREDETEFNPEAAIEELGATAELTFREGSTIAGDLVIEGKDVASASAQYSSSGDYTGYFVSLELNDEGAEKFGEATGRLVGTNTPISIWMDEDLISSATVNERIDGGQAMITSPNFTAQEVTDLANKINAGALPFKLETENFSSISPTLGEGAKTAMIMAGLIAFSVIAVFMLVLYRLPGFVAIIALTGQIAGSVAAISGYFSTFSSFTLTLPGIAGIILSVGMGVDANIITASRIKEELRGGKTLASAVQAGSKNSLKAILFGNTTVIIVALILMGAFGPTDSMLAKLLYPIFFMFGPSTTGMVYSFGYTLLMGVIYNFIFGVLASRLMISSLSKFKIFQKPWLFGGVK